MGVPSSRVTAAEQARAQGFNDLPNAYSELKRREMNFKSAPMRRDIVLRWLFWAWVEETQDERIATSIRRLIDKDVNEVIESYIRYDYPGGTKSGRSYCTGIVDSGHLVSKYGDTAL